MKYVKALLVVQDGKNLLLEVPSDWRVRLGVDKFLMCKNPAGKDTVYNLAMVESITELEDKLYDDMVASIEKRRQDEMAETLGLNSQDKK